MSAPEQQRQLAEGDELYERHVKHLEAEHWGEYVAIACNGRTVLAPTLGEVGRKAVETFGRGNDIDVFKVGPRDVGRL